ncbi:malonate decarboxylase gamma subunit [Novosphingobium sp. Rr 2-17]|uniref:biotin-independent malonate decarboxylase subunit gamma n=1 Tax=Novosphingobium sp. Rr 2-17 TaxID=555793 RepID=UPI00026998DF|nr:biotin-independent malonate decarboxylase subunit gamma [Novosphingobium sp. Rr 2-17]EIZ77393.1 malonate decarboxylase gamma subunit [Novosphingobium sp. Rr 2-17]
MTPADILTSLFPHGHNVADLDTLPHGIGHIDANTTVHVLGVTGSTFPGIDEAVTVAGRVLEIARSGDGLPIVFLLDSGSQRMSRRDELLGLSETLAHLAKALRIAGVNGHRTIGLLYGGTAAGAFIATALACETLVALPGAHPEVMDLPSMARVTKLSLDVLQEKARATAVFAPGLDNIAATGGILETWDEALPLVDQLQKLLADNAPADDGRAVLGKERGGRSKAADIAAIVREQALAHG